MIGRNLGPSSCTVGAGNCSDILTEKATVVSTNTVLAITDKEMRDQDLLRRMAKFDHYIEKKIGDKVNG